MEEASRLPCTSRASRFGAWSLEESVPTGCADAICVATGLTVGVSDLVSTVLPCPAAYAMLRPKMIDTERKAARFTVGLGKRRNLYYISV